MSFSIIQRTNSVSLVKSIATSGNVLKLKRITILEKFNPKKAHKMSMESLYFIGSLIAVTLITPNLFSQPLFTGNTFWTDRRACTVLRM